MHQLFTIVTIPIPKCNNPQLLQKLLQFARFLLCETADETISALRLLCEKYSPGIDPTHEIDKFIKAVAVIRIDIEEITGKEAIELARTRNPH